MPDEQMVKAILKQGKTLMGPRTPRERGRAPVPPTRMRGDGETKVDVPLKVVQKHPEVFVDAEEVLAKAKAAPAKKGAKKAEE